MGYAALNPSYAVTGGPNVPVGWVKERCDVTHQDGAYSGAPFKIQFTNKS
jgi:hypothetical protein